MSLSDIILTWAKLAAGEEIDKTNIFFKFISIWIAFSGIYSARYDEGTERGNIFAFADEEDISTRHKDLLIEDPVYNKAIKYLDDGITDMRLPGTIPKHIKNLRNVRRVLNIVYLVRCNLLHSGKDINDPRDEKIVDASYTIISRLIEPLLDPDIINSWDKTTLNAYDDDPPELPVY
jgi:hypothetical protein